MTDFTNFQEKLYSELGEAIRTARKRAGLTQADLAQVVSLSRTSITNIEGGRQKILLDTLYEIASAVNTSPKQLLPSIDIDRRELFARSISNLEGIDREWISQVLETVNEEI